MSNAIDKILLKRIYRQYFALAGGTADITVHQKMADGSLKEIHKAGGGAWGGNEVDKAYLKMLTDIAGPEAIKTFKREEMMDYFYLLRGFEMKKRAITTSIDGKMTFKMPASLREIAELDGVQMQEKIDRSCSKTTMRWAGDKLRIEKAAAKALFESLLKALILHISKMFLDPTIEDVDAILLVGGFGECELVKEEFEKHFANKR